MFCLTNRSAYSQTKKIDSLKSIIKKGLKDTTHVKTLNKLSVSLRISEQLVEAEEYANEALKLANSINYKKGVAYAYKNKGLVEYYRGDFNKVVDSWLRSLEIFEATQDTLGISNMTNNLGAVFFSSAGNATSIDFYKKSLLLSEKIGDTTRIKTALINLGSIYSDLKDYDNALTYYEKVPKYHFKSNHSQFKIAYLRGMGDISSGKGDHQKAVDYYRDILLNSRDTLADFSWIYMRLGEEEGKLGNISNGIEYLLIADEHAKKNNQLLNRPQILTFLGNLYKSKDLNKALTAYKEAENIAIDKELRNDLIEIYTGLSEVFKAQGDLNNSLMYLNKSIVKRDSVKVDESNKNLEKQFFDFQITSTKEEISGLQKEAILQELSAKRQKYVIYATVGTLTIVLFLAIGVLNRFRYVKKTNKIIEEEKNRSESLLLNILPSEIADELKLKGSADARDFDLVSVIFTDFKGFTKASEKLTAKELIAEINHCFMAFDHICEKHGIEKIKTIGDAYMAVGGLPIPSDDSVKQTILAALEMQSFITERIKEKQAKNEVPFEMRCGINSGPVVAGIVGVKKFQYDIWGDTVNTASRMESSGDIGKVNISKDTYDLIKDDSQFRFVSRGKIQVKSKGEIDMFFVTKRS